MPGIIDFADNPNNKLNSDCITTLRLRNDNKYRVDYEHWVILKQNNRTINKGLFRIMAVNVFTLDKITPFISYLEFGLNPERGKEKFQSFHNGRNIDWQTQELSFVLLLKMKKHHS